MCSSFSSLPLKMSHEHCCVFILLVEGWETRENQGRWMEKGKVWWLITQFWGTRTLLRLFFPLFFSIIIVKYKIKLQYLMNFVLLCWSRKIRDGWGLLSERTCPQSNGYGLGLGLRFGPGPLLRLCWSWFFSWDHLGIKLNKHFLYSWWYDLRHVI